MLMGMRADFCVGTGEDAEWIGSARLDGNEWADVRNNPVASGATTASHFVTDLSHTLAQSTGVPFRALSLVDNACWLTATSNDLSYEDVFLCQVQALSNPGDVVFGLSVSGSSLYFVRALEWASKNRRHTVALVGRNGGALKSLADHVIVVDESHYGRVEDVHGVICHVISFALAVVGK